MTEQQTDFLKIWSELSEETREICQLIGPVPTGLSSLESWNDEKPLDNFFSELRERKLLIERTYKEELEEKSKLITQERKTSLITPQGPIPPLTNEEKTALSAMDSLKTFSEKSLNSKRVQLIPEFGKFVESEI